MPRLLVVCAALMFATLASADDKQKPNTLSPTEIADGWILLFDGETTFGWADRKVVNADFYEIGVKEGVLTLIGKNGGFASIENTSPFRHFELVGEFRVSGKSELSRGSLDINLRHEFPSVGNSFPIELPKSEDWKTFTVRLTPESWTATVAGEVVREWKAPTGKDKDRLVPVVLQESRLRFSIPEKTDSRLELRNLKLKPLNASLLFGGKSLDGWKVNKADPKRVASKWELTPDGELSVKDGPGDLVTDAEFANFLLQLECKSNGSGLNSGIFFRCIPGQYQNGYEAQIQNAFVDGDRSKPKDFGTGAIYRRIAARKVVSNDKEWLTMTVIADGKHIATWVNGYQTVDWTDERPANDNPRQGFRAAKGRLSIQGHDPTTDLLFRNIRITEIPEKK